MPPLPSGPNPKRQRAERAGLRAEMLAAWFLRLKGYRILATRYRTPVGEIDIVARHWRTLVFVEVKARRSAEEYGMALEAVNARRISRAANHYLAHRRLSPDTDMRFDVIFLAPHRWPRHLINAFGA
jgi:putative endonuclease